MSELTIDQQRTIESLYGKNKIQPKQKRIQPYKRQEREDRIFPTIMVVTFENGSTQKIEPSDKFTHSKPEAWTELADAIAMGKPHTFQTM